MLTDLPGRLGNIRLPYSKPLAPLFECVMNSIHSIELGRTAAGRIDIHVRRVPRQGTLAPVVDGLQRVSGFAVTDNGAGFHTDNYRSFETSDSTYKRTIGGKGIGRLLWLKAFREAQVNSVYVEGGKTWRRSFAFRPTSSGIEDHEQVELLAQSAPLQTTVELFDIAEAYGEHCPQSASLVAERLIEHLLVIFLQPGGPALFVHDEEDETHIDVKELYVDQFSEGVAQVPLTVGDLSFTCHLARLYAAEEKRHRFFLCAHKRDVLAENLQSHIPDLIRRLEDDRGQFVLLAYVIGEYLDANVNQERTAIRFADPDETSLLSEITRQQLVEGIVQVVQEHVAPLLQSVREEKRAHIEKYVATAAPEYRPLLKAKYAELINDIPPHLSPEKLDTELHKRAFRIESRVREQAADIRASSADTPDELEQLKQKYADLIDEENEIGKARLAKYVVHRKSILEMFERKLGLQANGNYALESSIHEIICPLRTTSDDIPFEKLNLWIIDERLAFHHYLASDKPLSSVEPIDVKDASRPDLVVFNRPIAFVDSNPPFQSIVIVEFKRPMREDYKGKDAITQVYEYADLIKTGNAVDRKGRPIPWRSIPFYAYVICDITPEVTAACRKAQLLETPDGMGFFGFNTHYNTYIEVMTFTRVLENSKNRNRVFFEHLGLPAT